LGDSAEHCAAGDNLESDRHHHRHLEKTVNAFAKWQLLPLQSVWWRLPTRRNTVPQLLSVDAVALRRRPTHQHRLQATRGYGSQNRIYLLPESGGSSH